MSNDNETDWNTIFIMAFFLSAIVSGILGIYWNNFILRLYSGISALIIFAMFLQPMNGKVIGRDNL